jgi:hypothetical protein
MVDQQALPHMSESGLYWLLGTSVRKIANSPFPISPFLLSGYSNWIEKKAGVFNPALQKNGSSYEKNRHLLVEHAQGNHAVDASRPPTVLSILSCITFV